MNIDMPALVLFLSLSNILQATILCIQVRKNREGRENMHAIFNTSSDAALITRLSDGQIMDINEGFVHLTGWARGEAIGKSTTDINFWGNSRDRSVIVELIEKKGLCENLEFTFRRKTGEELTGIISAKLIAYHGKAHISSVIKDITERKKTELHIQELMHQLEIERNYAQIRSLTDGLTGLSNRRHFDEVLNTEFFRLKRTFSYLSLIMLDIDHFKKFNDKYGHQEGDECLRLIGAALRNSVGRSPDLAARYGGEEFTVILPETENDGAMLVAERIRRAVEESAIPHTDSPTSDRVTVSLGVVTVQPAALVTPDQAVALADRALYYAKEKGRNRIEFAQSPGTGEKGRTDDASGFVKLTWSANNESGNRIIDDEHRRLLVLSNTLLSALLGRYEKTECSILIRSLIDEIVTHFRDEENIFTLAEYPNADAHRKCHAELVSKALALAERYDRDAMTLGDLFSFLAYDVVTQHIFLEDRKYFPYLQP